LWIRIWLANAPMPRWVSVVGVAFGLHLAAPLVAERQDADLQRDEQTGQMDLRFAHLPDGSAP
jgi:hypothetical protein